jgi:type II secretion system protein N
MPELSYLARHPAIRKALIPVTAGIAFLLFLVWTFPYDTLARRLEAEAQRNGADLTIGSMGPAGFLGVRANDVRVHTGDGSPEIKLDRADVSPDLFAMLLRRTSFGFDVRAYGGRAKGHAALSNDARQPGLTSLRLDARDIDLNTLPLKDMGGVAANGTLQLKMDVSGLKPVETAGGTIQLTADGLGLSGSVMGMTLPRTNLGKVESSATIDKGVAKLDKTSARGGDIDADVDGTVSLRPLLSLSQAELHVRFKPAQPWLDANAMVKGMIGLIQNARQSDGSYLFTLTGPLSRIQSRPGR